MINNKEKYTQFIKTESKRLGFLSCGISKAGFLETEAPRLEKWLNENQDATKEVYDSRLKDVQDKLTPLLGSNPNSGGIPAGFDPSQFTKASQSAPPTHTEPSVKIEEVD